MPVDPTEQRAVTFLAKRIRDQLHGARNWDEAGIAHHVAKVAHLHLADVANAAIRAADDRSLDTPGAISNPQAPCWRERKTDRPQTREPYDPGGTCGSCGKSRDTCDRARDADPDPHEFVSVHDTNRAARRSDRKASE